MKRTPLKRRARKKQPGDDPDYLRFVRELRCIIGEKSGLPKPCRGRVEAHHAGAHAFARRAADRTAIPLCGWHHRESMDSVHKLGKNFWAHHNLDRDAIIKELNAQYELAQKRD